MKKSAFTLIELLVVIAIIAILAGIALPVFNKVLEKGRVTQDCSNLRQLGIGTVAFLNDNNDTLFYKDSTAIDQKNNTLGAPGLLEVNYVPNPQVFVSPFDKRNPTPGKNNLSYGVNSNVLVDRTTGPSSTAFDGSWPKLVAASQLILYCPAYTGDPTTLGSWTAFDTTAGVAVPAGGTSMTKGTHQNGKAIDVLYADMHVASLKFTDFKTTTDQSTANGIDGVNQWKPLGNQQQ